MISVIAYTSRMNMATRERMLAIAGRGAKDRTDARVRPISTTFSSVHNMNEGFGWEQVTELDNFDNTVRRFTRSRA